jgi:hypothetical protein
VYQIPPEHTAHAEHAQPQERQTLPAAINQSNAQLTVSNTAAFIGSTQHVFAGEVKVDDNSTNFLDLPFEIRMMVYNFVFPKTEDRSKTLCYHNGLAKENGVRVQRHRAIKSDLDLQLLRTCRQVYEEARVQLYSRIELRMPKVYEIPKFFAKVGPLNFANLRSIRLNVQAAEKLNVWLNTLKLLASSIPNLRVLSVEFFMDWSLNERPIRRGLGDHYLVARALTRFRKLREIHLRGFHDTRWEGFLRRSLKCIVRVEPGHSCGQRHGNLNSEMCTDRRCREVYDAWQLGVVQDPL